MHPLGITTPLSHMAIIDGRVMVELLYAVDKARVDSSSDGFVV